MSPSGENNTFSYQSIVLSEAAGLTDKWTTCPCPCFNVLTTAKSYSFSLWLYSVNWRRAGGINRLEDPVFNILGVRKDWSKLFKSALNHHLLTLFLNLQMIFFNCASDPFSLQFCPLKLSTCFANFPPWEVFEQGLWVPVSHKALWMGEQLLPDTYTGLLAVRIPGLNPGGVRVNKGLEVGHSRFR